jgi:hypothetical protein
MTTYDFIKTHIANSREFTNKAYKWSVRDIEIKNDPFNNCRPIINVRLDVLDTLPYVVSATELAVDLQNRLSGTSRPATLPEISKVIFNPPCTIVLWSDKTKTVVKCQDGDMFDHEKGLAMAIVKKMYGNTGKYCDIFKKWVPKVEAKNEGPIYPGDFFAKNMQPELDRIKRIAEQSAMSVTEALNAIYGHPKKGE